MITRDLLKGRKLEPGAEERFRTIPALESDGKSATPYVPAYIAKRPWYLGEESEGSPNTLEHQTVPLKHDPEQFDIGPEKLDAHQRRAAFKQAKAPVKYQKGACPNCGSLSHKARDCLERPRKLGAKFTGQNMKGEEEGVVFKGGFEAKRDRWIGYDPASYQDQFIEAAAVEARRLELEQEERRKKAETKNENDAEFDSEDLEDDDQKDTVGFGEKTKLVPTNLRNRDDVAGYLKKDTTGTYDPKSRSMKETEEGDFVKAKQVQSSSHQEAWQAKINGVVKDPTWQANPTQAELSHRSAKIQAQEKTVQIKAALIDKYGGQQYLKSTQMASVQPADVVEFGDV